MPMSGKFGGRWLAGFVSALATLFFGGCGSPSGVRVAADSGAVHLDAAGAERPPVKDAAPLPEPPRDAVADRVGVDRVAPRDASISDRSSVDRIYGTDAP